jgi:hypothetical protein
MNFLGIQAWWEILLLDQAESRKSSKDRDLQKGRGF